MDVSGGSGQPRSGNEEPAEHPAGPTAPATGPADHPGPPPHHAPAPRPLDSDRGPVNEDTGDGRPPDTDAHTGRENAAHDDSTRGKNTGDRDTRDTDSRHDDVPDQDTGAAAEAQDGDAAVDGAGEASARREGAQDRGTGADGAVAAEAQDGDAAVDGDGDAGDPGDPGGPPRDAAPTDPAAVRNDQHHNAEHRSLAHSGIARSEPPKPRPKEPGGGILMGRPFGVPVYVAPSWFLVAALITWVFGGQLDRVLPELGAARYLVSLFFAVAFYASVLVHELAHTVAAIRFKLPVRRIQLQFFGGVSEIEKEAETPGREFVLAFVGPLLSLVLAALFYLAMKPVEPRSVPGVLLAGLMISNLIVAAFNLLPGLPLDGGRMLRAVVWKITGKPMSGTVAAAWVGRALAVAVLIGLPLLNQSGALGGDGADTGGMDTVTDALLAAILAAIIWTGAGNSLRMARLREHLPELRARTLTRRAVPVETDTPLSEALRRANAAGARALVVVDADGNPLSLVREAAIVGVPEHRRPWVTVSGLAQELTDGMRVSAELAGEDLLDVLRATPATEYLVVEETGEIYGVLSAADVERAFVKAMARPSV
ncbi:site-2 protease family protein [Streptomyces sp. FXJ1.172]|uniref:site-2 protease family protein n=1 Tax=Streptomyces sp. FXJ1.172 TaxID=710705 RepID=UPI0007CFCA7F|nr:site-2 protease family protein [Streptomyces sp. FXJ1.172]WEO98417.1 site-2 protease family protein [Streptomyces sp. FXJ1.172]